MEVCCQERDEVLDHYNYTLALALNDTEPSEPECPLGKPTFNFLKHLVKLT